MSCEGMVRKEPVIPWYPARKIILRCMPLLVSLLLAHSSRGQICTQLIDAGRGSPIPGCSVFDGAGRLLTDSDAEGRFCLTPPLPEALVLQAPGYHARHLVPEDLVGDTIHLAPLRVDLPELRITPDPQRSLGTAMLTATEVDSSLLQGFERAGLYSAMQWVPGVQMDQRGHGGSTRLSIRGSLLRSPFGVRGVKVYWGGLPITLADGSTPLELLDPMLVGSMQVVRSVGPPAYGSAPSGLLLVRPPWPTGEGGGFQAAITGGSFGFRRLEGSGTWSSGKDALVVGMVHQRSDGYRDQERSARDQVMVLSRHVRGRTTLHTLITLQNVGWQLPGGLDSATAATAPTSANDFSQRIDARLEKQQLLAGLLMEHRLGEGLTLLATVHGQFIDKLNPFGTSPVFSGYKEEDIGAAGSRLALAGERGLGRWTLGGSVGTEVLGQRDRLNERVYVQALPDSFRLRTVTRVMCVNLFAEARLTGPGGTEFFAGVGMEQYTHRNNDRLSDLAVDALRTSEPLPVLGISQRVKQRWWVSLRHGLAVSRPTVWELLGSDGVFSTGLLPEQVRETELAISHGAPWDKLQAQVAGYLRRTDGLILPVPSAQGTGNDFGNAGSARQQGVEAFLHWWPGPHTGRGTSILATLTLQDHVVDRDNTPNTHSVPGIPAVAAGAMLRHAWPIGLELGAGVRHVDEVPVGATAQDRLPAYQVLHVRAEWRQTTGRSGILSAFVLVENLGDANYTSFVQASDPLGRYHNPAPGRSVFIGLCFQRQAPRR
jgi:iron complex outermembrane receptor protein